MNERRLNGFIELADNELAQLTDARGATLRVARGRVWVTQHQDTRDIVLSAGDAWAVERQGLTLVQAQGPAALQISGAAVASARARSTARWLERIGGWLRAIAPPRRARGSMPYY